MSDVAKWTLLVAGAVALIALIIALPFVKFIDVGEFASILSQIVDIAGSGFLFGRGLLNNFLTPFGRKVLTGLIYWLFGKWILPITIKIGAWIYHWVLK